MKKIKRVVALITSMCLCLTGCGAKKQADVETEEISNNTSIDSEYDRETIYQVSLLQGLTFGEYNGSVSVADLKKRGDIGIGTFEGLNGELIAIDGKVYRAAGDGSVEEVSDDTLIPFSNVSFFDEDVKDTLNGVDDITALQDILNQKVSELGENKFYFIRIDGTFNEMNVRSEYAQEEPYKPLAEVLETDQTFFDYENIEGTVVGLYCPPYMSDLNATGWHLHFVSSDKTKGGHVLGLNVDEAELGMDITEGFEMALPDNEMFADFDLTIDQSEDIEKVEKNTSGDAEEEKEETNAATAPEEDSSDFVLLSEAVPNAILEIRYYSTYNFVGERIDGYEEPVALLTTEAATALKEVSDDLEEQGYRLKIFDAYRPHRSALAFSEWAKTHKVARGVIAKDGKSAHCHGNAVDLTALDKNNNYVKMIKDGKIVTQWAKQWAGFDDFDGNGNYCADDDRWNKSNTNKLRQIMAKGGFNSLDTEYWHFSIGGKSGEYLDVPY